MRVGAVLDNALEFRREMEVDECAVDNGRERHDDAIVRMEAVVNKGVVDQRNFTRAHDKLYSAESLLSSCEARRDLAIREAGYDLGEFKNKVGRIRTTGM